MLPNEFWIVITQWDVDPNGAFRDGMLPKGPLIHEGYCATEEQAYERAKMLAGRYGWATTLRVNVAQAMALPDAIHQCSSPEDKKDKPEATYPTPF